MSALAIALASANDIWSTPMEIWGACQNTLSELRTWREVQSAEPGHMPPTMSDIMGLRPGRQVRVSNHREDFWVTVRCRTSEDDADGLVFLGEIAHLRVGAPEYGVGSLIVVEPGNICCIGQP